MTTQNKNVPTLRFPEFIENWEIKKLGELCEKIQDGNYGADYPRADEFIEKGIPFLTSKAVDSNGHIIRNKIDYISEEKHKQLKKAHLKLHDVLFTNRGANVGNVALVNESIANGNIGPQLTLLRCNNSTYFLYLKEVLNTFALRKQISSQDSGSAMNFFGIGDTSKFNIPLPTLPEQKKIGAFLSAVDEKIQQLARKKDFLEQYKKGVMQKIFNQEIRFKDDNGNNFADGEEKELGDFTLWASGGTPSKYIDSYWNGDIPWISGSSMRGIKYSDSKLKLTAEGLKNGSKLAQEGSLLILVRGSMLFNTIPIGITTRDIAFNQDVKSIRCNEETNPIYLLYWFISLENKLLNMVTETGIGAGKLDLIELKKLNIFVPSFPEQTKIANFLSAIDEKINLVNKQLEKTKEYKKGLLQQMFV